MMERKIRYAQYQGAMDEAERARIRASDLYQIGDTVLVWVNEGDLGMVGECLDAPPNRPRDTEGATDIGAAAGELKEYLFGDMHWAPLNEPGFIAMSADCLHVFIHAEEKNWHRPVQTVWFQGWPVQWHFGIGRAVATAAA